jgi:hypothetical protein
MLNGNNFRMKNKTIVYRIHSEKGQPMFFVKAVLTRLSLVDYTGIPDDHCMVWDWDVFPLEKSDFNRITNIEGQLNPEAEAAVDKKTAFVILICSVLEYLKNNKDRSKFINKSIAHHN